MNSKERFSDRVDTYVRYRPSYPAEALDYLFGAVGLRAGSEVADVGAGTGKFTTLLIERGCRVTAVEPNQAMREAAEQSLAEASERSSTGEATPETTGQMSVGGAAPEATGGISAGGAVVRFVDGAAEATGLPDASVDFVVCAQSFHWFDRSLTQKEFHRILRPGGRAALIWNSRLTEGTPFREEYDRLLRTYGIDYEKVGHKNISPDALAPFFKEGAMQVARFAYKQEFDFAGLCGRTQSSSYMPIPGHPGYQPMIAALRDLFERTQVDGRVAFEYETEVYWGEV